MDLGAVIVGGIVLLSMIAMSVYGATTLPPGAQVPVHHGLGGYNNWVSKNVALVIWPATGAVVFVIMVSTAARAGASGTAPPTLILPFVLLIVAFAQYGAIRAALRRSGSD